jgi:hypothetical protein
MLKVTSKTITQWAAARKLSASRTAGGHHRNKSAVIQALRQPPTDPGPAGGGLR